MSDKMSSRERLLSTINHQEPDRVPICFRDVAPLKNRWKNPFERALALRELGVDDRIFIPGPKIVYPNTEYNDIGSIYARYGSSPYQFHPDVKVKSWEDKTVDENYTILYKEFETPKGNLRFAARKTEDWQVDDLPLHSDHFWSRGIEYLIKEPEDLEKLRYLYYDPLKTDLTAFREFAKAAKEFATKHDILLEGESSPASSFALNLRGPSNFMCDVADNSAIAEELLDIISGWIMGGVEILLDIGIDTMYHSACYETTAFWSPDMYRKYFRPRIQKKIDMCHQAGVKVHTYMDLGVMPLIQDFKEMGIDILSTLDPPPLGDTDLEVVKREVGDSICLWGGVDSPHTIERGTTEEVREAVKSAISIAAPGGGFVLSTADSIWDPNAYDNVMAFIEAGLEFGKYPISL